MTLAVRTGMADLIGVVRGLVADPAGPTALFTDLDIQQALDRHRIDTYYRELTVPWEIAPDEHGHARTVWRRFHAPYGWWDTDWTLYGPNRLPLVLAPGECVPDELNGIWTFPAGRPQSLLWLSGRSYDPYGAAVLLLERAIAGLVDDYDVRTPEGATLTRSQKNAQRHALVRQYRLAMRTRVVAQSRSNERWR